MSTTSSPPIRNVLGPQIQKIRKAKGWSQVKMVQKIQLKGWGVERTVMTKIEKGRRCLTDYELLVIAQVLGVTLNDLLPPNVGNLRGFFKN
ncbi:MAG: helix-turn-helix transcriptional regulator [Verrucomicrobiota bacterium]